MSLRLPSAPFFNFEHRTSNVEPRLEIIDTPATTKYNNLVELESLKICKYGDEVLKVKAAEIRDITGRIVDLAAAMTRTMHQAPGIGLAAPQVGESLQLITVDLSVGENPEELLIVINPLIVAAEGYEISEEGCLSVPGYSLPIKRSARISLRGTLLDGRDLAPISRACRPGCCSTRSTISTAC